MNQTTISSHSMLTVLPMASSIEKLESVMGILPEITYRKMMNEYLLYKEGRLFGGIYDDRLLLKIELN